MTWPTPQDYNEAIQNPHHNLGDDELREGRIELNALGLPRVSSGAFASVYKVSARSRDVALRCFLQNVTDQEQRYQAISQFVMSDDLDYTVSFDYLSRGILVHGAWRPVLKMDWVQGRPLDVYVRASLNDRQALVDLRNRFQRMLIDLAEAGIAHGDLQHGNILVAGGGDLRLVDYDGMFVPGLSAMGSNELGHRNFQHPMRCATDFGPHLDNFSGWSIITSLDCLIADPELFMDLHAGDECLLFRQSDYKSPASSRSFILLEAHKDEAVRLAAKRLRSILRLAVRDVPSIAEQIDISADLPELPRVPPQETKSISPVFGFGIGVDAKAEKKQSDSRNPRLLADGSWPSVNHYLAALQMEGRSLVDMQLRKYRAEIVGDHVSYKLTKDSILFRLDGQQESLQIKLWLSDDVGRAQHYRELAETLEVMPDYIRNFFVRFSYQQEGIVVCGQRFPILKMQRAVGLPLHHVAGSMPGRSELEKITHQFRLMITLLRKERIIHGDLEPANMIWWQGKLILVDYDQTVTPGMSANAEWKVQQNYRHPRSYEGAYDVISNENFAAWVIDCSLVCLARQPDLVTLVQRDRLLFSASDFQNPSTSYLFAKLASSEHATVRNRAALLKAFCQIEPCEIPDLGQMAAISVQFAELHGLDNFVSVGEGLMSPDERDDWVVPAHLDGYLPDADALPDPSMSLTAPPAVAKLPVVGESQLGFAVLWLAVCMWLVAFTNVYFAMVVFTCGIAAVKRLPGPRP